MTVLSFPTGDRDASRAQEWADALGIERSEPLCDALRRHLAWLSSGGDADRRAAPPTNHDEGAMAGLADWGPAEDWSDWVQAPP
jgi:hypothetical protein